MLWLFWQKKSSIKPSLVSAFWEYAKKFKVKSRTRGHSLPQSKALYYYSSVQLCNPGFYFACSCYLIVVVNFCKCCCCCFCSFFTAFTSCRQCCGCFRFGVVVTLKERWKRMLPNFVVLVKYRTKLRTLNLPTDNNHYLCQEYYT